jgi:hypothetical protein
MQALIGNVERRLRLALVLLTFAVSGCSWTRFDDVADNAPVMLLNKPDDMNAFGVSLAVVTEEGRGTRVLVGGAPGLTSPAAAYDIGLADAADSGFCDDPSVPCYFSNRPAALGRAEVGDSEPAEWCFVLGAGQAKPSEDEYGLIGRCYGGLEYTLPVPPVVLSDVIEDELIDQGPSARAIIRMAADRDLKAALVATAEVQKLAWYYRPMSERPVLLTPPGGAEESYGASQAVLRLGTDGPQGTSSRLVLVGAPDAGQVWLFGGDDGEGNAVGCLGGPAGFGRALATGNVDGDGFDDLIVSDDVSVTVISGAALQGLEKNDDIVCSMSAFGPDAIIASFGCGSRDAISGCPGGFGAALDVGDLDGDGDGEVLVGAPDITVRGTSGAGAVLIYDAEGSSPEELSDILYVASRESGDRLGSTVVAAPIPGRDIVVAGIPGSARTAVFYCSDFAPDGGGGRCE